MTTYLENVLSTFKTDVDVMIKLSSHSVYDGGFEMQDGCGNHHPSNWIEAIERNSLQHMFKVKNIELEVCVWDNDRLQYIITLENGKDEFTHILDVESNNAAIRHMFDSD